MRDRPDMAPADISKLEPVKMVVPPGRTVVGVPAATINWAGGGVHCITQQLPAA